MTIKDKEIAPYIIKVDENNYEVIHDTGRVDKKNNSVFTTKGYYSSMKSAVNKIIELKLINSSGEVCNLKQWVENYSNIKNSIAIWE